MRDSDERNEVGEEGTETVDDLAGSASQRNPLLTDRRLTVDSDGFLPDLQRPGMPSYPFHIQRIEEFSRLRRCSSRKVHIGVDRRDRFW